MRTFKKDSKPDGLVINPDRRAFMVFVIAVVILGIYAFVKFAL